MGSSGVVKSGSISWIGLMSSYIVEKLGGIAGFGGPSARIRSTGRIEFSSLVETDQQFLMNLFAHKPELNQKLCPDELKYRITTGSDERQMAIELPESLTPSFIKKCVRDELV